jgi:mono/diheme cytochrome c family protein
MSNKLKLSYVLMAVGVTLMVGGVFLLAQPALVQAAGPDPTNLTNEAGLLPPRSPAAQADPGKGGYIFALAGGCGCHMGEAGLMAGGAPFEGPFGVVYPPNITPDPNTGLGNWSDQEIIDAIRLGHTPEGEQLFPIMPYPTFSHMSDEDVQNLVAFLRTLPPIENSVPERQLNFEVPPFSAMAPAPATAPTSGVERGAYIVNAIAHCGDCHTPFNPDGTPDFSKMLAGAVIEGQLAPNITPHEETGIGSWSEQDIARLLQTGQRPGNEPPAAGLMALVVEGGYKDMTDADALAVAAYLKTVPAVENVPQMPEMAADEAAAPAEAPAALPVSGGERGWGRAILLGLGLVLLVAGLWLQRNRLTAR